MSLTINSLQNQISINTCVQSILSKPGESWSNSRALYSHIGKGIKIISDRSVDSFILYPINESKLEDFRGLSEITLSVSSAKNCPENSEGDWKLHPFCHPLDTPLPLTNLQ